jgi:hypothetical protein
VLEQLNNPDLQKASVWTDTLSHTLVKTAEKVIKANPPSRAKNKERREKKEKDADAIYHRPDQWARGFVERLFPGGIARVKGYKADEVTTEQLAAERKKMYAQFAKAVRRSKELEKPKLIFINIDESPTQFRYQSTSRAKLLCRKDNAKKIEKPISEGQTDDKKHISAQLAHSTCPAFNREVLIPSFMMCAKGGTKIGKRGKPIQTEGSVKNRLEKAFEELAGKVPEFRPPIYNEKGTVTKEIFLKEMKALAKKMDTFAEQRNYTVYYVLLIDGASTHKDWKEEFPDGAPRAGKVKTVSKHTAKNVANTK